MTKTSEPIKRSAAHQAVVHTFVSKNEGDVVISNAREVEDDYLEYYRTQDVGGLIEPPYLPKRLEQLVQTNNTLPPCIEAMVNNIDGTGYEIERRDGATMEQADIDAVLPAVDFFNECSPMTSFQTLRKKLRRDLEVTGMGYMEIQRSASGELVFAGYLESKMMRLARLDAAVPVEVEINRGGKTVTYTRMKRERRYAQRVGGKLVWFAEYGASRDLHRATGIWAEKGVKLPALDRASEVIMLGIDPDITTPYFTPRWISQVPSVTGSRSAEEHNLEFFASGGIPPYLVIVQGGQLAEATVTAVRDALNQKGAHARVQVIEAFSTGGDLNSGTNVQVKVERFGAERTNDSMFAKYDSDCESRVRKSFRLPPILIGKSEDYSFASAHASYLVAEAQVFKPEREEFDEVVSATLLPELLGSKDYVFRSKPISIVDAATQLSAITAAMVTQRADPEHILTMIGEISGMKFKVSEELNIETPEGVVTTAPLEGNTPKTPTSKAEQLFGSINPELLGTALAVMTCGSQAQSK